MSLPTRKVCLLGDVGVGKTSLATRFAHGGFSSDYLTTVGVRIETRVVALAHGPSIKFVVWDIEGTDAPEAIRGSYLHGASGYLLVADGTRPGTMAVARRLREALAVGPGALPVVLLVNKRDLHGEWALDEEALAAVDAAHVPVLTTSARTGENVDAAFQLLALQMQLAAGEGG